MAAKIILPWYAEGTDLIPTEQCNSKSVRSFYVDKDAYEYDKQLDDLFVGAGFVGNVRKTVDDDWKADLSIGGTCVTTFKLDTGADVNVISFKVYEKVNVKKSILENWLCVDLILQQQNQAQWSYTTTIKMSGE